MNSLDEKINRLIKTLKPHIYRKRVASHLLPSRVAIAALWISSLSEISYKCIPIPSRLVIKNDWVRQSMD